MKLCGLTISTLVTTPCSLTAIVLSNSPANEWWANVAPEVNGIAVPIARANAAQSLMSASRCDAAGSIVGESCYRFVTRGQGSRMTGLLQPQRMGQRLLR